MEIFRMPNGQDQRYPKVQTVKDGNKHKKHNQEEEEQKQKKKKGMESIFEHLADNIAQHSEG